MKRRYLYCALAAVMIAGSTVAQEPIGMTDCAVCHDDVAPMFAAGAHGGAMARQSQQLLERSCVACHGPAEAHIDDPSTENIVRSPGADACLGCHPGRRATMELLVPAHNRQGVSCYDCHASGHADTGADHLLQSEARELCSSCHQIEAASFRMPFAHRDGTEPFQCTACHSVHADTRVGRLNLLSGGGACVDCHSEKEGPFIFPHPPVDRPGCIACHTPHGSTNPRLLTRRSISHLCLECHTDVPTFHDLGRTRYQDCQTCHAAVHGSNRDPRLIEE